MFFSADLEMDKLPMILDTFCCSVIDLQVILEIPGLSITVILWKDNAWWKQKILLSNAHQEN